MRVPGAKPPVMGADPVAAAKFSLAHWPIFLEAVTTDISQVFNGSSRSSCEQKLLPGSLLIYDIEAITFPFVDVLICLEVRVDAI